MNLRRFQRGMLYLRTGSNGSCKTLFTLADVRAMQLKELRPVYYTKGRWEPVAEVIHGEFGWIPFDFKDWQSLPDGAIILADEVQEDLPRRANGSMVPEYVLKLAQHRKRGFDFFMMTQHGSNIDSFVTKLIGAPGWHQHFKRVAGGSSVTSILQFDAYNNTAEKSGSGKSAQVTMRSQPKEVYSWYRSAELHTAKLKIPKAAIYLVVAVPCIVALFWFAGWMLWKKNVAPKGVVPAGEAATGAPGQTSDAPRRERPKTASEYVADYRPRIAGLMHTAPIYDKLTEPKRVPIPAACVLMPSKGCKCFTQDATPYPVDQAMCRGMVEHGTFYAFQAEGERVADVRREMVSAKPQNEPQARAEPIVIDSLPQALPAAPAPAPAAPQPQRIASVKR